GYRPPPRQTAEKKKSEPTGGKWNEPASFDRSVRGCMCRLFAEWSAAAAKLQSVCRGGSRCRSLSGFGLARFSCPGRPSVDIPILRCSPRRIEASIQGGHDSVRHNDGRETGKQCRVGYQ